MRRQLITGTGVLALGLAAIGAAAPPALAQVAVACSNRSALASALATAPDRAVLTLAPSCAYTLNSPLPAVTGTMVIQGDGATLRPAPGIRSPLIDDRGNLTVDRLNVRGGGTAIEVIGHGRLTVSGGSYRGTAGPAVKVSEDDEPGVTTITGVTFTADSGGVSYFNEAGELDIINCRFLRNSGGVSEFALNGEINGSVFTGNTSGDGGAVWADDDGGPGLTGDTLTGNTASGDGGAVYDAGGGGDADVIRSLVYGNRAGEDGGGIYEASNQAIGGEHLTDDLITGNTAGRDGGGSWNIGSTITGTTISGNTAMRDGGGIYSAAGFFAELSGSAVAGNRAFRDGGGIWNSGDADLDAASRVTRNQAAAGGGIWSEPDVGANVGITGGSSVTLNEPDNCEPAGSARGACTG
jgi:hypothetical protein